MPEAAPRFERRSTLRMMIFQGRGGHRGMAPCFWKVQSSAGRWGWMEPRDLVLRMPTPVLTRRHAYELSETNFEEYCSALEVCALHARIQRKLPRE